MEGEAQGRLLALRNTLGHVTLIQSWHLEIGHLEQPCPARLCRGQG